MMRLMKPHTITGIFAIVTLVMLAAAGCGNHDQASGGSGTMTPEQIKQNAQKQNDPASAPATAGAPAAPATH